MTSDVQKAFSGVDVVLMLAKVDSQNDDDDDRRHGLKNVVSISRQHGAAIDKFAKKNVKVQQEAQLSQRHRASPAYYIAG